MRVLVTLNFDHLMERALREEGLEPTVVRSVEDLVGLAPLHTIRCLVVHLHGDYLTATTMRNTTAELAEYESQVVDFLQRVLHDHALLIVGWSAAYDPALRGEISRSLLERYTSYWIDPGALRTTATDLAAKHRIVRIQSTADDVLGRLADAVAALDDRHARHPHSITDAVGTAKRDLSGQSVAVRVHDRLHIAMTHLWQHPNLNLVDFQQDQEPYNKVVARLVEATMVPAALVAATSYWGDERSDAWFLPEVIRFSTRSRSDGIVRLLALPELCGTVLFHAAGVAAVAAGRLAAARALLTAGAVPLHGRHLTLRERLHAANGFAESPAPSTVVMKHLEPIFAEQLALGPHAYEEAWEMFDLLDLLEGVAGHPSFTERAAAYAFAETNKINADELMNEAERGSDADVHDTAQGARFKAHQSEQQALGDIADLVWAQGNHVRVTREDFTHHRAARAEALLHDLERSGATHPLAVAGFGGGDWTALRLALKAVSVSVDRIASNHGQRLALQGGGATPRDYFWLDTGEAPRY